MLAWLKRRMCKRMASELRELRESGRKEDLEAVEKLLRTGHQNLNTQYFLFNQSGRMDGSVCQCVSSVCLSVCVCGHKRARCVSVGFVGGVLMLFKG